MSISGIGNGKKALGASASTASGLASLVAEVTEVTDSGSQLNVYE